MAGKLFVLRKVEHFAPGFFENAAVLDGCVQLGKKAGSFASAGSYTTTPYSTDDFFDLLPSWNADTPKGTSIEVQARVLSGGKWSEWLSFGVWSPYIERAAAQNTGDDIATFNGQALTLVPGCPGATMAQMRVLFKTSNPNLSPRLYLLSFCTNATERVETQDTAFERMLSAPAYSCLVRDNAIAPHIASATALCMMLNRYGCDLLPEEVAHLAYDYALQSYGHLSFLCATAGAYGFHSYLAYAGVAVLRSEVWQGRLVAARVNYRTSAGANVSYEEDHSLAAVWGGATANSNGHLVVVHGFTVEDGVQTVHIHDALCHSNSNVSISMPMATFAKIYSGIALVMQKSPGCEGKAFPTRKPAQIEVQTGKLHIFSSGEEIVPHVTEEHLQRDTLCYTISDDKAYASAAQRKFYYPDIANYSGIPFNEDEITGRRVTCYFIGATDEAWVAEKQF